jgi:acyl-CoA reductase-like NAD-dependent aldehyde dehydrogenase
MNGFKERSEYLLSIAEEALAPISLPEKPNFERKIVREPLGVVLIIAAWNYPYLVSINALLPALLAGNTVLLKQAPQTFPCAERYKKALIEAGLPEGVFDVLNAGHEVCEKVIKDKRVGHVQFTGSVRGGKEVEKIAAGSEGYFKCKYIHYKQLRTGI